MKKKKMLSPFGVFLALLVITVFNACDIIDEIIDDPSTPTEELGTVLWTYTDFNVNPVATDPVSITAPAIGSDGTIYVASFDRIGAEWQNAKVHAINPDSTFKWASPELSSPWVSTPAIGSDGTIYIITSSTIYAISPLDGSINWSYQPPADNNEQHDLGWITLGNNGEIFFAHIASGTYTRKIYALNNNGGVMWKHDVGWGASELAVGLDGTLFAYWLENGDIKTYGALASASGAIIWSKVIESTPRGSAISPNGDLVLSLTYPTYQLVKLDATSGAFLWQVDALEGYPSISSDGSIFLNSSDLYCYNSDGTLKWQSGSYSGSAAKIAIDSDGNSYGTITDHGDGNFQVYSPDGSPEWAKYQDMTASYCPAIGSNNVIYLTVASVPEGTLYAIQGDKPLASSGWPRDTGGNKNSRNINLH